MSNQPEVFSFKGNEVRSKVLSGEPYFCLADVCKILDISNSRDTKERLDPKGVAITDSLSKGGVQRTTFINESNLYRVIFKSRKPEAEEFTKWVTSEVLPAIRKSGSYGAEQAVTQTLDKLSDNLNTVAKILLNHIQDEQALSGKSFLLPQNAIETRFESREDHPGSFSDTNIRLPGNAALPPQQASKKVVLKNLATGETIPFTSLKSAICFLGLPLSFCRRDFMGLMVYDNWQFILDGMGERK